MRKNKLLKIFVLFVFLLIICSGCYSSFGRQLFYRLDCYKFKVVDIDNKPVPDAEMTFYYKSNLDISGKHSRDYREKIRTNEKGEVTRFGWVRNDPYLEWIKAKGFYTNNDHNFRIKNRETTITLFPKRNPVALFEGTVSFRLEEKYNGKLHFRFSDLEFSIPSSREYRISYQWDEKEKISKWERKYNADFQPDLILDFQNSKLVSIEFASATLPAVPNHKSVFAGIYEAPQTGYDKVKLSFDDDDCYFRKPIIFTFSYRGKTCYGLIRRFDSWILNRIIFDYQLNLSGDRNLEHDNKAKMHLKTEQHKLIFQQRHKLWSGRFTPFSIKTAIGEAK